MNKRFLLTLFIIFAVLCCLVACTNSDDTEIPVVDKPNEDIITSPNEDIDNPQISILPNPIVYSEGLEYKISADGTHSYLFSKGSFSGKELYVQPTYGGLPVTRISAGAMSNCYQLTMVVLPDSVEAIDNWAFSGCYNIRTLVVGKNFNSYQNDPDTFNKLIDYYNLSDNSTFALGLNEHTTIYEPLSTVMDENGYVFLEKDNKTYLVGYDGDSSILTLPQSYNGKEYELYPYAFAKLQNITSITLPSCIKSISKSAFRESSVQNIIMTDAVTIIHDNAFAYCQSLQNINLSNNLTEIDEEAFLYCISLKSIDFGNKLRKINVNAFKNCVALKKIILPPSFIGLYGWKMFEDCEGLEEVVFSEGIEDTGDSAFKSCDSLKTVYLPNSLDKIDNATFYNCLKLESFIYNGTVSEWKIIQKDYQWSSGTADFIITCLDGTISKDGTIRYN